MFIRLRDLEVRPQEFDETFEPGSIEFGPELRQLGELKTSGRAELVREHEGREVVEDIRLVGKLSGRFETSCARCLEPVSREVSRSFDLLYRPLESTRGSDEVSINTAETEIGFYSGDGMELEDSLREQILLEVPIKSVCRPDCKGLCPKCGKNLNVESCQCMQTAEDERWNALRELKKHLQ